MASGSGYTNDHTSPSIALSWGISVRVSELGGSLQGYKQTKPVCNALRSCHRFGRGPEAHITKLSQELVEEIAKHVARPAMKATALEWAEDLCCFEQRCKRDHHISTETRIDARIAVDESMSLDGFDADSDDDEANEAEATARFEHMLDEYASEVHHERIDQWKGRVWQLASSAAHDPAKDHDIALNKVLMSDFGIAATIAHRIGCGELQHSLKSGSLRTTTCYIHLPGGWAQGPPDNDAVHQMLAVVEPSKLLLDDKAKAMLGRALRILELKPYVHPLQVSLNRAHPLYEANYKVGCLHRIDPSDLTKLLKKTARAYGRSTWPKLINLLPEPHSLPISCGCWMCFEEDESDYELEEIDWEAHGSPI